MTKFTREELVEVINTRIGWVNSDMGESPRECQAALLNLVKKYQSILSIIQEAPDSKFKQEENV